jgi:hypothetical protein
MAILNPDHLFDQARRLVTLSPAGPPRQVDLRRAISSAYYGLFHFTLASLADLFVGKAYQATSRYALVYRAIDHRSLRILCVEAQKRSPSRGYGPYIPATGFGAEIALFAGAVIDLQEKRHQADYNPQPRFRTRDAVLAIAAARSAVRSFKQAGEHQQKAFLTLLLCPPR